MKLTPWLFGSLTAVALAACDGSGRRNNDTGSSVGAGTDTAAVQSGATGTATDTAMNAGTDTTGMSGGMSSDTARTGAWMHADSSAPAGKKSSSSGKTNPNQTKSGVTDTKTGESTLGKGVTQTSPDQNQPVTAKGDTLRSGGDSASGSTQ